MACGTWGTARARVANSQWGARRAAGAARTSAPCRVRTTWAGRSSVRSPRCRPPLPRRRRARRRGRAAARALPSSDPTRPHLQEPLPSDVAREPSRRPLARPPLLRARLSQCSGSPAPRHIDTRAARHPNTHPPPAPMGSDVNKVSILAIHKN